MVKAVYEYYLTQTPADAHPAIFAVYVQIQTAIAEGELDEGMLREVNGSFHGDIV